MTTEGEKLPNRVLIHSDVKSFSYLKVEQGWCAAGQVRPAALSFLRKRYRC